MTRHCALALAAAATLSALGATGIDAQQNPPRDTRTASRGAPPAPTGTAVLGGVVTTDDGSRPIAFAYMLLIGTSTGIVKVSSTDAAGRFTFTALPADRYTVAASKPPYLGAIAGARRPARPGTPIAVADGQTISNVTIRMFPGGAISGVVTDERGQTGGTLAVSLQQWRTQSGRRSLAVVPGGTIRADDRGRYRFFGLPPGEYVVSATKFGAPTIARPLSDLEVDAALRAAESTPASQPAPAPAAYAPFFYPGTSRAIDAGAIALGPGEDRQGVDIRLELVPTSRLDGTLTADDGQPIGSTTVIINSEQQRTSSARTQPDGTFMARGLVPGTYTLLAVARRYPGQFAQAIVEVAGVDVAGVRLVMRPGLTLSGQLVFEGGGVLPSPAGRYIPLQRADPGSGGEGLIVNPQSSLTSETGAFTITNVMPGRYVIGGPMSFGPTKDTMAWTLKSVVADGRDVTDLPVEISTDNAPRSVVVTYSDVHQELTGRLQSQSGAGVSDYTIVAFPEDRAYWSYRSRRIVTARPGTDGRFVLSGPGPASLPPGRYLLAAVTDIDPGEQFDAEFLVQLVPASVPIALARGERKVQNLAIK